MKYIVPSLAGLTMFSTAVLAKDIAIIEKNFSLSGEKAEITTRYGQTCLSLYRGRAQVNDLEFTNGTIEYDVAFDQSRSFIDVQFRSIDENNAEKVYLRPHQSGNPDANQYTPVYNGLDAWQLYHHGFGGRVNYHFDKWNHVKIKVNGTQGQVFINDMSKPAITINEFLGPTQAGSVSFGSSNKNSCYANIRVTSEQPTELFAETKETLQPQGLIRHWKVSETVKAEVISSTELDAKTLQNLGWNTFDVDRHGILNLARSSGLSDVKNTALVKTIIQSENDTIQALKFGYSDQATVYLNGTKIYQGNNTFRSRDYRYLGTVGLFDTLYLPLNKGANDLTIAVSERFGGWGLIATLDQ